MTLHVTQVCNPRCRFGHEAVRPGNVEERRHTNGHVDRIQG